MTTISRSRRPERALYKKLFLLFGVAVLIVGVAIARDEISGVLWRVFRPVAAVRSSALGGVSGIGAQFSSKASLMRENIRLREALEILPQGIVFLVIGLGQLGGAILTIRTMSKRARLVALVGAGFGIVLPVLGLLTIVILAFAVYAIFFSSDARAVFGDPGGPRFLRPRT